MDLKMLYFCLYILSINFIYAKESKLTKAKDFVKQKLLTISNVIDNLRKFKTRSTVDSSSKTDTEADSSSKAGSGTSSLSMGESKSYSNTRVKTKISASSNAKSNSSAAAKAKAFAKTNTETKVKTSLGTVNNNSKNKPQASSTSIQPVPYPNHPTTPSEVTRPTHAYWSPSFGTTLVPTTIGGLNSFSSNDTKTVTQTPSTETKVICVNCPVPCPYPYPCPCPCPVSKPSTTVVYCNAPCPPVHPPNPPQQVPINIIPIIPQTVNTMPCTQVGTPCYPLSQTCDCVDYVNCPCKRTNIDTNSSNSGLDAIPAHEIYISHNFTYEHGAVAADHYKCSEIGKNVLKKGGSAMDAAIATHFCVEIINCHSTGLGGGGFLLAYDRKKEEAFTIDFRETLPRYFNENKVMTQGDTILVPGVLKGLELGHKKMGKLPWKDLFTDAIKLAEEGFIIHEALAEAIAKKKDYILTNLGLKEVFAPNGYLLTKGNRVKRTKLAETYKKIADSGGSDIFYKGEIAMDIVKDIREAGGSINLEDLKSYKAIIRKPLKTHVANLTLYGILPPASSVTVAMMLKLMEKFKWNRHKLRANPGLFYHQMIEAMKFAYAPATFIQDPNFTGIDKNVVDYMLSESTINKTFKKINNKSHNVEYYGPYSKFDRKFNGTSHISVVAPNGDAVSITSSINAHFGSRVLSRRLGFIYNNELSDFVTFWPKVYNYTRDARKPGKRPVSKVSPLIFTDKNGEVKIAIGAAGGFFIPTTLASTLSYFLFLNDNITTAVSRPRIHCQLFPPTVVVEDTFPKTIGPLLNQYRHNYVTNDTYSASGQAHAIMGVVQAIIRNKEGKLEAACDYRKGGLPSGF